MVFLGTTKNPDIQLDTTAEYPARDTAIQTDTIRQPFLTYDKSYVISLYFEHGVEDMLGLTHSCCVETYGRCNHCFFCKEREWAFSKLGMPDPGTN
jgi:7-cyano-7-deazaguanine synthase in queuosine biosynthesis